MNVKEVAEFYAKCMGARPWLKPLGATELQVWAVMLQDVPARESDFIVQEILGISEHSDEYRFFEAKTVLVAWENIKSERRKILDAIHSIDRYVKIEDDPGVLAEKLAKRERLKRLLPRHVVEYAGVEQVQLNPPPKYPRSEVPVAPPESVRRALGFVGRPV